MMECGIKIERLMSVACSWGMIRGKYSCKCAQPAGILASNCVCVVRLRWSAWSEACMAAYLLDAVCQNFVSDLVLDNRLSRCSVRAACIQGSGSRQCPTQLHAKAILCFCSRTRGW